MTLALFAVALILQFCLSIPFPVFQPYHSTRWPQLLALSYPMLLFLLSFAACPPHPHSAFTESFKRQHFLSLPDTTDCCPFVPFCMVLTSAVDVANDAFLFLLFSCITTATTIEDAIFYLHLPLFPGWCLWFDRCSKCLSSSSLIDWLNEPVKECDIFWNWVFVFFCSIGRSNKASNWKQRQWYGY